MNDIFASLNQIGRKLRRLRSYIGYRVFVCHLYTHLFVPIWFILQVDHSLVVLDFLLITYVFGKGCVIFLGSSIVGRFSVLVMALKTFFSLIDWT